MSVEQRAEVEAALAVMRRYVAAPETAGTRMDTHILLARPRRGLWMSTWSNLPGLTLCGSEYQHALLPRWSYTAAEIRTEMIEDLERLARTGEQPRVTTRGSPPLPLLKDLR